jgi:hypothetical protein
MTKKKVRIKGPINDFITSRCSFFTPIPFRVQGFNVYKVNLFWEEKGGVYKEKEANGNQAVKNSEADGMF